MIKKLNTSPLSENEYEGNLIVRFYNEAGDPLNGVTFGLFDEQSKELTKMDLTTDMVVMSISQDCYISASRNHYLNSITNKIIYKPDSV